METIDLSVIKDAERHRDPYDFVLGRDIIREDAIAPLRETFPEVAKPGSNTASEIGLDGLFRTFVEELEGPELTEELSRVFDRDLHACPRLTTIMRHSSTKHGAIHTDGKSKVMTLLVYMNDAWEDSPAGKLRALYDGENFEPFAVQIEPTMGRFFAFLRADNSWHGHKPYAGERRVVQVAWLTDASALNKKKRLNRFARALKSTFAPARQNA